MRYPFKRHQARTAVLDRPEARPAKAHELESDFCYAKCRFVLTCSCGATYETPCIDEALEYREMHLQLAPLNDQLAS